MVRVGGGRDGSRQLSWATRLAIRFLYLSAPLCRLECRFWRADILHLQAAGRHPHGFPLGLERLGIDVPRPEGHSRRLPSTGGESAPVGTGGPGVLFRQASGPPAVYLIILASWNKSLASRA